VRSLALVAVLCLWSAHCSAASWTVETVDPGGVGRFSSLAIDRDTNAHVAYVLDDGRNTLKYGFWDHSLKRWFLMNVADNASFCSLTLDSKQHPQISFVDYGTMAGSKLRYAHWDGKAWTVIAVPLSAETIAYYTSIVLDANDNPTISFYEYNGPKGTDFRVRLRTVTWNGKFWAVQTIDGENQSGKFNAMVRDQQGSIHLAYANVNTMTASTRYAHWDGKSWSLETVDGKAQNQEENVGYSMCIAIDREGNPHLSYMNYTSPALKYAVRINGKWEVQTIARVSGVAYPDRNSIIVDDSGTTYIGYYDAGPGVLKLVHNDGKKWITEVVDSNASGANSSLQTDHGTLWITYADESHNALKIAHRPLADAPSGINRQAAASEAAYKGLK
jgi:hypothetical protein